MDVMMHFLHVAIVRLLLLLITTMKEIVKTELKAIVRKAWSAMDAAEEDVGVGLTQKTSTPPYQLLYRERVVRCCNSLININFGNLI